MEKLVLYKNKPETFKCQFKVDGASTSDTTIRLCLEFNNNKNLFFYGKLHDDGQCQIEIPTLDEVKDNGCKLVIEAIADSVYFKVYEADVEFKKTVEVSVKVETTAHEDRKPGISIEAIKPEIKERSIKSKPVKKEHKEEEKEQIVERVERNPYIPLSESNQKEVSPFAQYLKRKKLK